MNETILIVEDDESVAEGLKDLLSASDYHIILTKTTKETLSILKLHSVDLMILDVHLENENGYDLCLKIRQNFDLPILFLTGCSSEQELVHGFQSGGDDYMTKPFRVQELLVRIQALLRRSSSRHNIIFKSGDLLLDTNTHQAFKNHLLLELTVTEQKLILLFMQSWPRTLSREELFYQLWDKKNAFVESNTLNVNISRLREKLGTYENQNYIETIRSIGYRWAIPVKR